MKTFTINKKVYQSREVTFGDMRTLERMGINVFAMGDESQIFNTISGFLAMYTGLSLDEMDNEINEHLINGGSIEELAEVMNEALKESRFFQSLNKRAEKEVPASKK